MKSGYFRSEYMTMDEILNHAARYSKAFDIQKFHKLQNGDITPQEAERLMNGSPYYSAPETMFKKTVLRKLLNSGYIRLANSASIRETMDYDDKVESDIIPDLTIPEAPAEAKKTDPAAQEAAHAKDAPKDEKVPSEEKKPRQRAQKAPERQESAPTNATNAPTVEEYHLIEGAVVSSADDAIDSFFDGGDAE